jgi:hypothetical protein
MSDTGQIMVSGGPAAYPRLRLVRDGSLLVLRVG